MPAPTPSPWQRGLRESSPYLGLAWQILGAMVIFGGGGLWLDRHFGWSPWALLAGMGLSFVAIGAILYRIVVESNAASRRRHPKGAETGDANAAAKDARSDVEGSVKEGTEEG